MENQSNKEDISLHQRHDTDLFMECLEKVYMTDCLSRRPADEPV